MESLSAPPSAFTDQTVEGDAFVRLLQTFADEVKFSEAEKRAFKTCKVKPLLRVRLLTADEKKELAQSFDRYHMRLWSKLRRAIGAAPEASFRTRRGPAGSLHPVP